MTLNIKSSTIFDISFNNTSLKLSVGSDVIYSNIKTYTLTDLKPILLNQLVQNPEIVYYELRDCYSEKNPTNLTEYGLRHNLIILPSSMIGVEYVKTHIYTSAYKGKSNKDTKYNAVIEVLSGSAYIILQDRLETPTKLCTEVPGIVKLKQGEKFWIPTGFDYEFVNIKSTPSVISKVYVQDYKLNYGLFSAAKGLGHYIIRKNGRTEIVPNCCYQNTGQIKLIKHKELLKKNKLEVNTNIYNLPEKFIDYLA